MTGKNILLTTTMIFSVMLFITSANSSQVFAEEEQTQYNMVGDIIPTLTFMFRDGIETHEFPIFEMSENFVANSGTSFSVEGTITNSPLLHKALDEAYNNRLVSGNGYDYPFKFFDVETNFMKNGKPVLTLDYANCKIDNYQVDTIDSNDWESYFKEIGFAIVDKIDFNCSGVNYDNEVEQKSTRTSFTDYGPSGFKSANDVSTSVTFSFDQGMEKIEFPVFELVSGYEESSETVTAEFAIEGIVDNYDLLYNAIDNSRKVSGISKTSNIDFDALVEFADGDTVLRGFDFRNCRVSDSKIITHTDKEEGYTGKSGFAVVNQLGFTCSGFQPINMYYDALQGDTPIWKISKISNMYEEPIQNSVDGLKTIAKFTFADAVEIIEFTMFKQSDVISTSESVSSDKTFNRKSVYPAFELRGIVGNYPILYNYVDDNRSLHHVSGATSLRDFVDVEIEIVKDGNVIRGFDYSNCRPVDYVVTTETDKEESYVKDKFALENIFDFECQGYHPNNPVYDAMYNTYDKASTLNTNDLRNTEQWPPGFFME